MQAYILRRLLLNGLVLLLVATLVFVALRIDSDNVVQLAAQGTQITDIEEAKRAIKRTLGLDRPVFPNQYFDYLGDLLRLDLGTSFRTRTPVMSELKQRIGPSLELGLLQLMVALLVAIPVGVISAVRQDRWIDYVLRFVAIFFLGVPVFVLAVFALLGAARYLDWSPPLTTYRDPFPIPPFDTPAPEDLWINLQIMAIPAVVGGLGTGAIIMRFLRSQMLEVLRQDYIRTAWAKGLQERVIIVRHALKNALIPVVTVIGLVLGSVVSGNVVLESIFLIPGMGLYAVEGVRQNDYPVVQAMVLLVALFLVFVNLVVDVIYAWLDPRIRYAS
jgi:peptide/nickel transport system permease protein